MRFSFNGIAMSMNGDKPSCGMHRSTNHDHGDSTGLFLKVLGPLQNSFDQPQRFWSLLGIRIKTADRIRWSLKRRDPPHQNPQSPRARSMNNRSKRRREWFRPNWSCILGSPSDVDPRACGGMGIAGSTFASLSHHSEGGHCCQFQRRHDRWFLTKDTSCGRSTEPSNDIVRIFSLH